METLNCLLDLYNARANLNFLHMFFRRKKSAEISENFGGKFELFAALYDDSCEPQFFTYVFFRRKISAEFSENFGGKFELFAAL